MRVFLTGATGFVGSAVTRELISAGHQVLGLTRSDKGAEALRAAGAEPHHGTLEDLDSLRRGAETTDGTIHCGFIHDFSNFVKSCEIDRHAIETIGTALAGSDRPFLNTSGLAGFAPGRPSTEDDARARCDAPRPVRGADAGVGGARGARRGRAVVAVGAWRGRHHGFVPMLIKLAREKGFAAYIGEGTNLWPGVHRLDAAHLYRLALEKGTAGARHHGVADEGVPTRDTRGGDRPPPESAGPFPFRRGREGALRLDGVLFLHRPRGFERPDPRTPGLAAHPARPPGGPRTGTLFRAMMSVA